MARKTGIKGHNERTGPTRRFTRGELHALAAAAPQPCVSIFVPTHRPASEKKEDRIRFRNLLGEAEERLEALGLRSPAARELLEPGHALLEDDVFWEHQLDGLAAFAAKGFFRHYSVPLGLRELLVVGDAFHLKPLFPLLLWDGRYYLLALSQKKTALFEGTREALVPLHVPDLPQDLASAVGLPKFPPEHQVQLHSQAPRAGRRQAIFHGQSEESEDVTRYLRDFFHKVDRAVTTLIHGEKSPLILAAVEYLPPVYAALNTYPHLLPESVDGNPEEFNVEELHRRSRAVAEAASERDLEKALAEYSRHGGGPRSSEELSTVVVAAAAGRVERLFVATGVELWGTFDPRTLELRVHDKPEPGDRDLLDFAAVRTLSTDGTVYAVPRDRVPGKALLAALFRY